MSGCDCSGSCAETKDNPRYRRILQIAFVANAVMFLVEAGTGLFAQSAALQADALDFFADAANFGIGLFVLGMASRQRASAALAKGACMAVFGLWVLGNTAWHAWFGVLPKAEVMGIVGFLALATNGTVAALLYAYRQGDANMHSVWVCARNDAIGNVAVMLAATGVFAIGTNWPDIAVATLIGSLNLSGATGILIRASRELRHAPSIIR